MSKAVKSGTGKVTPATALQRLKDGNKAYLKGAPPCAEHNDDDRRKELCTKQEPFAVVVSCSDSRVPPERVFGCGIGELFVIRNAGNTVDTVALGSIQYAVGNLGSPLVVVMGHEACGAVTAAAKVVTDKTPFAGSIGRMLEPIIPAVLSVQKGKREGDAWDPVKDLDKAVCANVKRVVGELRSAPDPILSDKLKDGALEIVGARYDLHTGHVSFID